MSARRTSGNGSVNGNAVDLSTLRIIDSCMLFDACTGKFHTINSSAVFIFDELQGDASHADLIKNYMEEFDVNQATAERDVELFLNDLDVIR